MYARTNLVECIPRTGGRGEFSSKLATLISVEEAIVVVMEDVANTTVAQVVVDELR